MGLCSSITIKTLEKEAIEEAKKLAPLVIEAVKEKIKEEAPVLIEAAAKKIEAVIPAAEAHLPAKAVEVI